MISLEWCGFSPFLLSVEIGFERLNECVDKSREQHVLDLGDSVSTGGCCACDLLPSSSSLSVLLSSV